MTLLRAGRLAAWLVSGLVGCTQPRSPAAPVGGAAAPSVAAMPKGPLRVDPLNRRYFSDGTKAVYLTGSHTWPNNRDYSVTNPPQAFDYARYLDFLAAHNHNFFRLWTWEQPHSSIDNPDGLKRWFLPFPWQRTGPGNANDGKPRFDFTRFDQTYFDRLRSRVMAAGARGMYVAVMLFDGWDLVQAYNPTDGGFPYGAGNNVNNISSGGEESQALVHPEVTTVQEALVKKIVDTVNDLDNVLYEIANETSTGGVAWQNHMIDFLHQYEAGKPKQHPVGFTVPYPGNDADLYNSHADWISPNTRLTGGDGRKVVMNDSDHSYFWTVLKNDGPAAHRAWVWKIFMLGAGPMFMDPYLDVWEGRNAPNGSAPDPYWEVIRHAMGDTRTYANKLDLEKAVPSAALSSTTYCLAQLGAEYLVYQPGSGAFTLNVLAGTYKYEWYDPTTRTVAGTGTVTVPNGTRSFTPPFSGDAVLLLSR